jgi:hypothetical protein
MFASEAPATEVAAQAGIISKVTGLVTAPFCYAMNTTETTANWIADKSYLNTVIGKITGFSFLKDSCIDKPALIGKWIVISAAVYAAYKAYQKLNEQSTDNDDDMIFVDEEYVA